jgi:diguanylate cyclase (GGDEF)-like protein/PAS domain S-box-containing protein
MSLLYTCIIALLFLALMLMWFHLQKTKRKFQQQQQNQQQHEKHQQEQQQTLNHLQALINNIPDLTWVKDKDSRYILANKSFSGFYGLSQKNIIGKKDVDICTTIEQASAFLEDDIKIQKDNNVVIFEEKLIGADGASLWSETIKMPIYDQQDNVVGTAGVARDISKHKNIERDMKHLAYHDHLTGLPNKAYFTKQLSELIADQNSLIAVLLLDLNDFKTINDSLGHAYGDLVLIQIGKRLNSLVDENTMVARFGGDEFLISHHCCEGKDSLEKLLKALYQQFDTSITINEINYNFTASIGVAFSPDDGQDCETLLKNADLAMYQSKSNNHNHRVYFIPEFAKKSFYRMQLSNQLFEGVKNQELSLVYQPKVNSVDDSIVGVESLIRWKNKDGKSIPPADFIPIAEQNGIINEIGNWIIAHALKQMRTWLDKDLQVVPISINISANQLRHPKFIEYLFQQLDYYRVPGNLLEIEITESVLMENIEATIPLLNEMRKKGIMFSIDDFGTG